MKKPKIPKQQNQDESDAQSTPESDTATCRNCQKEVFEEGDALQCEICQLWFHIKCQKINAKTYKFLSSQYDQGLHLFCLVYERTTLNIHIPGLSRQKQS